MSADQRDEHEAAMDYSLDVLDPQAHREFEAHLATCPACQELVADVREGASVLSQEFVAQPPAALRESVLAEIARTPQDRAPAHAVDAPVDLAQRRQARDARQTRVPRWAVGLAAAAAVAVGAVAVSQVLPDQPQPTLAQQVLDADDATRHTANVGQAELTVVQSASMGEVVLVAEDLPAPSAGQVYQMWFVQEDGTMASAGLLTVAGSERTEVVLDGDSDGATAVGVSVEPPGGSEQPTTEPIAAVPLQG